MKNLRSLVPNAITLASMGCGVLAILGAMAGEPLTAAWWIVTATVLDGLDGMAARLLKAQSEIGAQLDSFSDFCAFGVAPPVVFVEALRPHAPLPVLVGAGFAYTACCAVRLAKFNLSEVRHTFSGMPSPMAAGVSTLILLLALKHDLDLSVAAVPLGLVPVLFGVAMVAPWLRYRKLGRETWRLQRRISVALVLSSWIFIFLRVFPEYLLAVSGSAAVLGPVLTHLGARKEAADAARG